MNHSGAKLYYIPSGLSLTTRLRSSRAVNSASTGCVTGRSISGSRGAAPRLGTSNRLHGMTGSSFGIKIRYELHFESAGLLLFQVSDVDRIGVVRLHEPVALTLQGGELSLCLVLRTALTGQQRRQMIEHEFPSACCLTAWPAISRANGRGCEASSLEPTTSTWCLG